MTDQMKTGPRHAGPTREVPLVGYTPRHDAEVNPPRLRPPNPNAAANESNTHVWPIQPAAARAMQPPRPHIPHPNIVIEPAPTVADAEKAQRHLVQMAAVIAVVLVLAIVVAVAVTR